MTSNNYIVHRRTNMLTVVLISLLVYTYLPLELVKCSEIGNEPKIIVPLDRINHQEGTNATFTCSIGSGELGSMMFEWRKDDLLVKPELNPKKLKLSTAAENYQSILRVLDLKASDAGVYSCIAKNKYGQDRVSTQLTVKVELKWSIKPRDVEIGAGKSLSVPCSAEGLPKPWIEWSKISETKMANSLIGPELRFGAVNPEDTGIYECRARNGVEKDLVSQISLNVLGHNKCYVSSQTKEEHDYEKNNKKKPNLRRAHDKTRNKTIVIAACVLVAIYMYPMIFRPLFFGQSMGNSNKKEMDDLRSLIEKNRPSNMPEWSDPFGPKKEN